MILEQIDLVDVEKTTVCARQQPRLERLDPLAQRLFKIQRADQPVLAGPERQVDHRHRRMRFAGAAEFDALTATPRRRTRITALFGHLNFGQQCRKRADCG